jgi:ABC-type glycerol-3-phosphate transport system permease component
VGADRHLRHAEPPVRDLVDDRFLEQIPPEVEESARIDGANGIKTFFFVILPLAAPGIVATSIFVALLAWNEFLIPVLLAGEDSKTLPVYISGFISARTLDWGPMAAASASRSSRSRSSPRSSSDGSSAA